MTYYVPCGTQNATYLLTLCNNFHMLMHSNFNHGQFWWVFLCVLIYWYYISQTVIIFFYSPPITVNVIYCSDNRSKFKAPATGQVGTYCPMQQVHIRGSGKVQVGKSGECRWLFTGSNLHRAEGESAAVIFQHSVYQPVCQSKTSHVGRGRILLH